MAKKYFSENNAKVFADKVKSLATSDIRKNYIDNSNYRINTKGQAEYTTSDASIATVNRWYIDGGILTPVENGVQFVNTSTESGSSSLVRLKQNVPFGFSEFAGKTLTLSARINGKVYTGTTTIPTEKPTEGTAVQYIAIGVPEFGINLNYSITGDYFIPYIALAYNQTITIEWMKLEVGDKCTTYIEPDYQTEYLKLQSMDDNGNPIAEDSYRFWATPLDGAVILQWKAITNDTVTKYRIQKLVDATWSTIVYPEATVTSYCDEGLTNGTTYNYRLLYHDAEDVYHKVADVTVCPVAVSINADTLGGKTANEIISEGRTPVVNFTYVVDSDQALNNWAKNVAGNDYTHVLIKAGTWNLTADTINLTTTGTKTVTGEAGNLIKHDMNVDSSVTTLQYDSVPLTGDYYIQGVNVVTYNRWTSVANGTPTNHHIYVFRNCINLSNCSAKGWTNYPATGSNYFYGFSSCKQLSCCFTDIDKDTMTSKNSFFYGYSTCEYLTNCRAYHSGSADHFVSYGFHGCTYISSCYLYISGSTQQTNGYYNCDYISSSYAYIGSSSTAYSFNLCEYITSCYGYTSSQAGTGVYKCNYMSNCKVYSIGSSMTGYNDCQHLDNCVYTTSSTNGGATGFKNCFGVRYCHYELTGLSGSGSYAPYSASYASLTANDTYACADGANGGWNTATIPTS